ncbi:Fumarate reductase iron-sulfur subunit [Anoxybacillus sp. BCO1]|nr:Fumarate reductase iron-sulfur subunit [Anoxybacillus sp. BCO1]
MNCLEEVCGACSMVINGKPRQSCTALVDQLEQPIRLEPMRTFPVIRDLQVDRSRMFDSLKKVKAWIPIDGTYDLGPGPRMPERKRQWAYELSKCMTCGVCLEACPNVNSNQTLSVQHRFRKCVYLMLTQQEQCIKRSVLKRLWVMVD